MSTPTHYIRTIHTSFTAANAASSYSYSSSPWAPTSYSARASSSHHASPLLGGFASNKYPPGLGLGDWSGSGSTKRAAGSSPTPAPSGYNARKRPGVRMPSHTYTSRRPPPPPPAPRTQPASLTYKFDPFSDEAAPLPYAPPRTRPASLASAAGAASAPPYTIHIPAATAADLGAPAPRIDPDARSKLVAGILLNRVHAVGRPMRRRLSGSGEPREYVKSGLSRVVSVEV